MKGPYDWATSTQAEIPGTEDWVEVTSLDAGSGYDWDTIKVWHSPSTQQFYSLASGGCSCNSFEDFLPASAGDFITYSSAQAAADAVRAWGESRTEGYYGLSSERVTSAREEILRLK